MAKEWQNEGPCNGTGDDTTCGEGDQVQFRQCTDGTVDKCTDEDTRRTIPCNAAGTALPSCPKVLGGWQNEGPCNAIGDDPTCGQGNQVQNRPCTDGTVEKCTKEEKKRTISCEIAGTALPDCRKFYVPLFLNENKNTSVNVS